jgi:uncharacterized protein (DUF1684 family)
MDKQRMVGIAVGLGLGLAACQGAVEGPGPEYRAEIERWRAQRATNLKADGSWLTVAGLFWLKEGPNTFGSDPANDIVLPDSAPPQAGVFEFQDGQTTVQVEPGVTIMVGDNPVTSLELQPDSAGKPTILELGPLEMRVIQREEKFGIRLKDQNSRRRQEFTGLEWFPVDEKYRVTARFITHDEPKVIPIPNVIGQVRDLQSPGYAVFELDGRDVRLHPVVYSPEDQDLFFIFRDATAPDETYGAGRFLYSSRPKEGSLVLDFNKAHSPPCAFTDFATCPLPPKENRLAVRIEAGEKKPAGSH